MDEILQEFKSESEEFLMQMEKLLEKLEDGQVGPEALESLGQVVDRIMGGAKTLALSLPPENAMERIGAYAELCKIISYKGSQVLNNKSFTLIIVAVLQDAIELLEAMILECDNLDELAELEGEQTFFERLQWVNSQFSKDLRSSVAINGSVDPKDIEQIIQKLKKKKG